MLLLLLLLQGLMLQILLLLLLLFLLQLEVARLREEKRLAGEIFSETICGYEEEIRHLKEAVAAAQQQLQVAKTAAAAAVAAAAAAGARGPGGTHCTRGGPHTQQRGGPEKAAAAAAGGGDGVSSLCVQDAAANPPFAVAASGSNSLVGDHPSPSSRSVASSRSLSDRQLPQEDTDDTADPGGGGPLGSRTLSRKETRTRFESPPEAPEAGPPPRTLPSFFSRRQIVETLDGVRGPSVSYCLFFCLLLGAAYFTAKSMMLLLLLLSLLLLLQQRPLEREQSRGGGGGGPSLPRISGPRSWKALLFSKVRKRP